MQSEKQTHEDLIIKIRNYSIAYRKELMPLFGGTEIAYNKFFGERVFSMTNSALESIIERIRVNISQNTNLEIISRVTDIVSNAIEMVLTNILGISMKGFAQGVKTDPEIERCLKEISCEMTLKMSPERRLILTIGRIALVTYKLNISSNQDNKIVLNQEEKKVDISHITEKYKDL